MKPPPQRCSERFGRQPISVSCRFWAGGAGFRGVQLCFGALLDTLRGTFIREPDVPTCQPGTEATVTKQPQRVGAALTGDSSHRQPTGLPTAGPGLRYLVGNSGLQTTVGWWAFPLLITDTSSGGRSFFPPGSLASLPDSSTLPQQPPCLRASLPQGLPPLNHGFTKHIHQ